MIVDRINRRMDAEALSIWLRRSKSMVWKHAVPADIDKETGHYLYDVDTETARFALIPRRKTEQQMAEVHGWLDPS